jgi:hypothetical protein
MRAIPPITPPTTGAAVNFGFDEMPAAADDFSACAEASACADAVVAVMEAELSEDATEGNPSMTIPVDVGVADTSLCGIGINVLEKMVGVVPFDAGKADVDVSLVLVLVLEGVAVVNVSTGATDVVAAAAGGVEVVVSGSGSGSGVLSIEVVGAVLDMEMTEAATLGELP